MIKSEINKKLSEENIKYYFIGKLKTYTLSKFPSGLLMFEIENAGFKIEINKQTNKNK